jgi:uncharacterized protein involved in exopolysaccharide biosynthesis
MPDIQTLFVAGLTGAFVALGAVLLAVSLWSARAPSKKER